MNWNWLPKDSGVPNLTLCQWVQSSKTCLSTHKCVITVSALNINLKGKKKETFWKVISNIMFTIFLVEKKIGAGTGEVVIKMEWHEEGL